MTHFLVLDAETTGRKAGYHEIAQVAAVVLDEQLRELGSFESLVRPLFPARAQEEAFAITGLSLAQLAEAPGPRDVFARLAEFVREHSDAPIFTGYNTPFDLRFLDVAEQSFGASIPRDPKLVCNLLTHARKCLPALRDHKLGTVAERYDIVFQAHDALGDVRATAEIMRRFHAEFPGIFVEYFLKAPTQTIADLAPAAAVETVNPKLIESLMHELAELKVAETNYQALVDAVVKDLPEAKLLASTRADIADLTGHLQAALKEASGVRECSFGKVGYQVRRTITHSAAAVRELAPAIAQFCISEAVDKAALEKHAKTAIKTGHLPADVLELLEAQAEVKESKAWICQPAMPAAVLEEVF